MRVCVGGGWGERAEPHGNGQEGQHSFLRSGANYANCSYVNEILVVGQKQRHIVPLLQSVNKGV